jgi:hypothetical protein
MVGCFTFAMSCLAGCDNGNGVHSEEEARRAYLGLDLSIDQALDLGLRGFNDAKSANIPPESGAGMIAGTITVTGQVDQGASDNKQMRLGVAMSGYSDVAHLVYATGASGNGAGGAGGTVEAQPTLDMSLKGIPSGTLSGELVGTFQMSGDLAGPVTLHLAFTADLQSNGASGTIRKAGTTHITGTAASPPGTYTVDVTR